MFGTRGSISRKLTWMNMLVSGSALLLAGVAFVSYDLIRFRETMVRNLSIQAEIVGSNSASALLFSDPTSAAGTLSGLKAAPNIVSAGIYTPAGEAFARLLAPWRKRNSTITSKPRGPDASPLVDRSAGHTGPANRLSGKDGWHRLYPIGFAGSK